MVRISDEEWSRDVQPKESKKLDALLKTLPRRNNHELHMAFSLTRHIAYDASSKPQFQGVVFMCPGKKEASDSEEWRERTPAQAPLAGLISLLNNADHPGGFVVKQLLNVFCSLLKQCTYIPSLLYVNSGRLLRALTPFARYLHIPLVQRLSPVMIELQKNVNRIETNKKKPYIYSTSGYLDVPHVDLDLFTLFVHMSNKFATSKCQQVLNSGNVFELELPVPLHQSKAASNKASQGFTQPGVVYVRVLGAGGHCLPSINICFDIRDNILTPETTKYGTFSEHGELHFCCEPLMEVGDGVAGLSEIDLQHMLEYGIFVSQWNPDLFALTKRVDASTGAVHSSRRFPTAREMMITCHVLHVVSELARTQGHIDPKTGCLTTNVDVAQTLLHQQVGKNDPTMPCHSRPTELYYLPINQRYAHPTTCMNVTADSVLTPAMPWTGEGTRSWTDKDRFPTIKGVSPIDASFVDILQHLLPRMGDVWKDTEAASLLTINAAFPKKKKQWKAAKKWVSESRKHLELSHGDQSYGGGRTCFDIQEMDSKGMHPATRKKYKHGRFPNGSGYFQNCADIIENIVDFAAYEIKYRPMVGASEFASPQVQAADTDLFVAVDGHTVRDRAVCHWCAKFAWQISREDSTFQGMTKCQGCRSVYYCGKQCQTAHWKCKPRAIHGQADRMEGLPHKKMCKKLNRVRLLVQKQVKDPQNNTSEFHNFRLDKEDQMMARILHSAPHVHLEARQAASSGGAITLSEENTSVCDFVRAYEQGDSYVVDPQQKMLNTKHKCHLQYVKDLETLLREVSNPRIKRQSKTAAATAVETSNKQTLGKYPYACKGGRRVGGGGKVFYGGDTWTPNEKTVAYLSDLSKQCSLYDSISCYYVLPFWVDNAQWDCNVEGLAAHMLASKKQEICVLGNVSYLPWTILNTKKSRLYPQWEKFAHGWVWDVREPKALRTLMTSMWSPVQLTGLKKKGYNGCVGRRGRFDVERNRVFVGLADGRECWVHVQNMQAFNPLKMKPNTYDHPAKGLPGQYSAWDVAAVRQIAVMSVVQRHATLFGDCPSEAASPLLMDFFKQLADIATEMFMGLKDQYATLVAAMDDATFGAFMAPFNNGVYLAEQHLTVQVANNCFRGLLHHGTNEAVGESAVERDWVLAHFCATIVSGSPPCTRVEE